MSKKVQMEIVIIIGLCFTVLFLLNFKAVPKGICDAAQQIREEKEHRYTFSDKIQIITVAINKECQETFSFKQFFINFNGLTGRVLGKNQINEITKLNNGYLSPVMEKVEIASQAENTVEFAQNLESEDMLFLFVQAPYLIEPGNKDLPIGIEDYSNENADSFLEVIRERGVEALDIRQTFMDSGEDYYTYFFKTDHHWNSEGAFLAYQSLTYELEEILKIDIPGEYTSRDSFEEKTYEKYFLGANGKRTGVYYNGVDDISFLYPEFGTDIYMSVPDEGIERKGDFKEAVLDWSHIENKDYYGKNCYHVYIGGEYPLVHMRNENAPVKKKLLLIKDSFALPVQAFLSTVFQKIDAIDLRVYQDGTVLDYAKETKPDIVIVLYNPYMLNDEKGFVFE